MDLTDGMMGTWAIASREPGLPRRPGPLVSVVIFPMENSVIVCMASHRQ